MGARKMFLIEPKDMKHLNIHIKNINPHDNLRCRVDQRQIDEPIKFHQNEAFMKLERSGSKNLFPP